MRMAKIVSNHEKVCTYSNGESEKKGPTRTLGPRRLGLSSYLLEILLSNAVAGVPVNNDTNPIDKDNDDEMIPKDTFRRETPCCSSNSTAATASSSAFVPAPLQRDDRLDVIRHPGEKHCTRPTNRAKRRAVRYMINTVLCCCHQQQKQ